MWSLMPEANGLPNHLVNVPLKDSPLSDCGGLCGDLDIQIKQEDDGVFSDLFVVKGIKIGHEIVSVHLLEPQLKNLADEIVLTVAEAMSLDSPSPVFVLVGAVIPYTLKVIRGNIPQDHNFNIFGPKPKETKWNWFNYQPGKAYTMPINRVDNKINGMLLAFHLPLAEK